MKAAKQIKLRLEKHELKVVRFGRQQKFFCQICQTETRHLTVAQMSVVLEISEINIFRLAESKQLHSLETANGKLMLCAESTKK